MARFKTYDHLKKRYKGYKSLSPYQQMADLFFDQLQKRQLAQNTIYIKWIDAIRFLNFLIGLRITNIQLVTADIINTFLITYSSRSNRFGKLNCGTTNHNCFKSLKDFFEILIEMKIVQYDPILKAAVPRTSKSLPKFNLSQEEMNRLLSIPDISTLRGIKERAILELLYGCGLRASELINLQIKDIDLKTRSLMVREGKGKKDRYVPIPQRTTEWLAKYMDIRKVLAPNVLQIFLGNTDKGPLKEMGLTFLVESIKKRSGISKHLSPHTFRHGYATHLLQQGAPLRAIQALLGHSQLISTQKYTHVAIAELKALHSKCHPREIRRGKTI